MASFHTDYEVVIIGGGLAGLVSACILAADGKKVLVVEKKEYPFHKVCGEYVSNEVLVYLQSLGFDPLQFGASVINRLRISTPAGQNVHADLDLGGFGLSRYTMDAALSALAKTKGAEVWTGAKVTDVEFADSHFTVSVAGKESVTAKLLIGSYGKRDVLDKKLNREFIQRHTGYMGVKYHVRLDYPIDEIGLDNFEGGYCGIVKIEENKYNICYLYKRNEKVKFKTLQELEETILYRNPVLRKIFTEADFVSREPEAINEISFSKKALIENHVLMCGDAAGLITPLCGNGMSMAIAGAKLLAEFILDSGILGLREISAKNRTELEMTYSRAWHKLFEKRLFWGRTIQGFFGIPFITDFCIRSIAAVPPVKKWLIGATHGKPLV